MMTIVPLRTVSESNQREHWSRRAERARGHRLTAALVVRSQRLPALPVVVMLTRIAPRALDDDNLRGALKAVRDGVADALGVDDRDPRVTWAYGQAKGAPRAYGVQIAVTPRAGAKGP